MSAVHIPDDLADRLSAVAARRGITVDELAAATLGRMFPDTGIDDSGDALEAFIGSGDSGDPSWAATDSAELRRQAAARRAG